MVYDKKFYDEIKDGSHLSAKHVIPIVKSVVPNISTIVDIGCGVGTWLKVWKEHIENAEILGVDINDVDKECFYIDYNDYKCVDLTRNYVDVSKEIVFKKYGKLDINKNKPFDMLQSLEVAEHIDEMYAENFIRLLTNLSNYILFSAAIPYQGGKHHVNCQAPEYWNRFFLNNDFVCLDVIRERIWNNKEIEWWYKQNIFLYVHKDYIEYVNKDFISGVTYSPRHLVHPEFFELICEMHKMPILNSSKLDIEENKKKNLFKYIFKKQ